MSTVQQECIDVRATGIDPLRTVHNSVYTQAAFELEMDRIFRKAWFLLGHQSEVPSPGSFLRRHLGGDPVFVVRGEDGAIRGFHNVCRHRGCLVVPSERGCVENLTCPYHYWSYSISDGSLVGVTQPEAYQDTGFDASSFGLVPFQVATLFGFVFGCLDESAGSLEDYLGSRAIEFLGRPLASVDLEIFRTETMPLRANWKTFAENIRDGYHVPFVHPWLRKASPPQKYLLFDNYHAAQYLMLGREAVSEQEWAITTSHPLPGMEGPEGYVFTMFPDSLIIVRSGEVHTMTEIPISAGESVLEIKVFAVAGDSPEVRAARTACYDMWSAKQPPEDTEVLQYQQVGLSSRSVRVSLVARGQDATSGSRGDDNRLRQFWAGWRDLMDLPFNEVPGT